MIQFTFMAHGHDIVSYWHVDLAAVLDMFGIDYPEYLGCYVLRSELA